MFKYFAYKTHISKCIWTIFTKEYTYELYQVANTLLRVIHRAGEDVNVQEISIYEAPVKLKGLCCQRLYCHEVQLV